jgi:hypothetical protein
LTELFIFDNIFIISQPYGGLGMNQQFQIQNPIALMAVQSSLAEYLVKCMGEDHILQASRCFFYDQRIQYIDSVIKRWWSDQLLITTGAAMSITEQLLSLRADAVSALNRSGTTKWMT